MIDLRHSKRLLNLSQLTSCSFILNGPELLFLLLVLLLLFDLLQFSDYCYLHKQRKVEGYYAIIFSENKLFNKLQLRQAILNYVFYFKRIVAKRSVIYCVHVISFVLVFMKQ